MYSKMKYRLKMLSTLLSFSGSYKPYFYIRFAVAAIIMILGFITPVLYSQFIEHVIIGARFERMIYIVMGYGIIYVLNGIFTYLSVYSKNKLVNFVALGIKEKILKSYFNREFSEYDHIDSGYMKTRMEDDTECIEKYFTVQSVDYVISLATVLISSVLLIALEWRLAVFAIISIPVTLAIDYAIAKKESVVLNASRKNSQNMAAWLHSSIQGWREIKALNLQKQEERRFMKFIHIYAITFGTWINYWTARYLVVPRIKEEFLMKFALYFFGGLMVINRQLEIAALLVFMQYYVLFAEHMQKVSETDAELISGTPQSDRLLEEIEKTAQITEIPEKSLTGYGIELKNVNFSYNVESGNVLNNLDLTIKEGERVAIKGKSGAGKTTILKLISGMLKPSEGSVLFAEENLANINLKQIHSRIGFVMQENMLLNDSIKENLLYGNPNAHMAEISDACEKAHILEFIEELPDGFDTIIGERGIKLSGGQKQRLVLARQFLRNVDIYIFDEATSALDQHSENIIQSAISDIAKDKTIIVVAHRESSLELCDRVISI